MDAIRNKWCDKSNKIVNIMRIFLTKLGELGLYPPALSIIKILRDEGHEVVYIGAYSDNIQKAILESKGVRFIETVNYFPEYNPLKKLRYLHKYKTQVKNALEKEGACGQDILWVFNADTICLLSDLVPSHKTILHFFEFVEARFNWKYTIVNPTYNFQSTLNNASAIIHCEYNRAHIFKGLYHLEKLPYILPNKPYLGDDAFTNIPKDIKDLVANIKEKVQEKKVVLYQGYFNSEQRRLEEFCMAVSGMGEDFVLLIMGRGNKSYEELRSKYSSDRIIFLPFINPPYHLLITQLAHVGVLSYFPTGRNYAEVINPIFCAPNKVFEYGMYGIPMISNDIPGLKCIYDKYDCGIAVSYPMTDKAIQSTLYEIFNNYKILSDGAQLFNDSTNIPQIVSGIIKDLS